MRPYPWTSRVRPPLLLLLLAEAGCQTPSDPCSAYRSDPLLLQQCIVRAAATAPALSEARCAESGEYHPDCEKVWARAHLDRPLGELLAACTTEDCKFYVLDYRGASFDETVAGCETLNGMREQCVAHASTRFLGSAPSLDAQRTAFSALSRWAEVIQRQIGSYIACGGTSDCSIVPTSTDFCDSARNRLADPSICMSFRPNFPALPGE